MSFLDSQKTNVYTDTRYVHSILDPSSRTRSLKSTRSLASVMYVVVLLSWAFLIWVAGGLRDSWFVDLLGFLYLERGWLVGLLG